jgi:SP family arabinose:H+ symporter-like MFS transporter
MGDDAWNTSTGWRYMFGSEAIPAVLFGMLAFFVPESPRWLMSKGKDAAALSTLTRLHGSTSANTQAAAIRERLSHADVNLSQLFVGRWRVPLFIGIVLAVFQQLSGINAIMYYAPEIFKSIGSTVGSAFTQTVAVGAVNLLFTIIAIKYVDRAGRKALLLAGTAIQAISLAVVGYLFRIQGNPMVLLAFVLIFVGAFAVAMGPVVWIIISEIFPNRVRGRAMSIATVALWTACYAVSQSFPMLVEGVGSAVTFWIYAICSLFTFLFVWSAVPETKSRTLEEIEDSWGHSHSSEAAPTVP